MNRRVYFYRGLLITLSALTVTLAGCGTNSPAGQAPSPSKSAVVDPTATPTPTVPAVVAILDIPSGTRITGDMVTVKNYTLNQEPVYVVRAPSQVVGKYAAVSIFSGQAVYLNMIVSVPSQCKAY